MLDIKVVRQDPERVKQAVKNRNGNLDKEVDQLLELDLQRREIITAVEELKAKQNSSVQKRGQGRNRYFRRDEGDLRQDQGR